MRKKSFIRVCGKDITVEGHLIRIARIDGDKYTFPDDPEAVIDGLRKCGMRIDLFTFLQRLSETSPKYAYPMKRDNLAVVLVTTFEHWWMHQIGFKARNKAKQAEKKGVTFREVPFGDILLEGICKIYNESPVRQGRPFPHYGMGLERARGYAGTFLDRSVYIGAFFGDSMIGFIKLVTDETGTQADLVHILSMIEHRDKAPTNALVAQAVRYCAERRISHLVYDNFSYGNKQGDSLSEFKERNGFQRVEVPRYYVPLTRLGWAAFRLGLDHHKFVDYFPEPVVARVRELRNTWYSRRLQTSTKVS
jgi:hypothetical protein